MLDNMEVLTLISEVEEEVVLTLKTYLRVHLEEVVEEEDREEVEEVEGAEESKTMMDLVTLEDEASSKKKKYS